MRVITQVCLPKNLHSHANLPLPNDDKLLPLLKLQQKWNAKAEMYIYTEKNSSLTYARKQSISYQTNSMANPYAESGLLVNRLVSPQWWNLLFHSCQSFHPNASCALDERLDVMSNNGQWCDLSSDNGCKSFAFSPHVAFAWKVSWKGTFFSNTLKHDD